ncbi:hypothetical protein SNEBB_007659 [Seison nebaliae]|nr:hypothetical protein SNEBB_007659 [Seison nebaliae]
MSITGHHQNDGDNVICISRMKMANDHEHGDTKDLGKEQNGRKSSNGRRMGKNKNRRRFNNFQSSNDKSEFHSQIEPSSYSKSNSKHTNKLRGDGKNSAISVVTTMNGTMPNQNSHILNPVMMRNNFVPSPFVSPTPTNQFYYNPYGYHAGSHFVPIQHPPPIPSTTSIPPPGHNLQFPSQSHNLLSYSYSAPIFNGQQPFQQPTAVNISYMAHSPTYPVEMNSHTFTNDNNNQSLNEFSLETSPLSSAMKFDENGSYMNFTEKLKKEETEVNERIEEYDCEKVNCVDEGKKGDRVDKMNDKSSNFDIDVKDENNDISKIDDITERPCLSVSSDTRLSSRKTPTDNVAIGNCTKETEMLVETTNIVTTATKSTDDENYDNLQIINQSNFSSLLPSTSSATSSLINTREESLPIEETITSTKSTKSSTSISSSSSVDIIDSKRNSLESIETNPISYCNYLPNDNTISETCLMTYPPTLYSPNVYPNVTTNQISPNNFNYYFVPQVVYDQSTTVQTPTSTIQPQPYGLHSSISSETQHLQQYYPNHLYYSTAEQQTSESLLLPMAQSQTPNEMLHEDNENMSNSNSTITTNAQIIQSPTMTINSKEVSKAQKTTSSMYIKDNVMYDESNKDSVVYTDQLFPGQQLIDSMYSQQQNKQENGHQQQTYFPITNENNLESQTSTNPVPSQSYYYFPDNMPRVFPNNYYPAYYYTPPLFVPSQQYANNFEEVSNQTSPTVIPIIPQLTVHNEV